MFTLKVFSRRGGYDAYSCERFSVQPPTQSQPFTQVTLDGGLTFRLDELPKIIVENQLGQTIDVLRERGANGLV